MLDRTWTLALNTLLLSGATCAMAVPLGGVLALALVRTDLPGRKPALVLLGVLVFLPLYLQAAAWQAGFAAQGWFTLISAGPVRLQGWPGAVWVHVMAALPWVVLIVGAGLWWVEPELEEQALLDGSPWQVFCRVTWRNALTSVGLAALWVLITTAGEMTVTDLFSVRTYAEELYTQYAVGNEPGHAPLAVLPGVILTAVLVAAGLALCVALVSRDRPLSLRPRRVFPLGRWRAPVGALVAAGLLLLVGIPLGSLCYKAGVVVSLTDEGWQRGWSLWKCLGIAAASPLRYRREFAWSLGIGALAASAAVVAGAGLAWLALAGRRATLLRRLAAAGVLAVAALGLALPGPVLALGTIRLLNHPAWAAIGWPADVDLYGRTILGPWLVLCARGLAPAVFILWHAFRTVPPELMECAALEGAGSWTRLGRIVLPSRLQAVGLAWLVAFAVAVADLAASVLVVPPGMTTLAIRIFDLLHAGVEDQVAGICLAQAAMFALLGGAVVWLARRWSATPA